MTNEASAWGFPETERLRSKGVARIALGAPESVKVLAAPSGYGKTIAAAEYGLSSDFDHAIWIDAGGASGPGDLLNRIALAFWEWTSGDDRNSDRPAVDVSDLMATLDLFRRRGDRLCVVLDDLSRAIGSVCDRQFADSRAALRGARGTLVVTTRESHAIHGLQDVQYVDERDLRLTREEADSIAIHTLGPGQDPSNIEEALKASGWHVAFFVVLLRHASLRWSGAQSDRHSLDLEGLLGRVVLAHLDTEDLRT